MKQHVFNKIMFILCSFCFFTTSFLRAITTTEQDIYVHSLASLTYHLWQFTRCSTITSDISFTQQEVDQLWNQIIERISDDPQAAELFIEAYAHYNYLKKKSALNREEKKQMESLYLFVKDFWRQAITIKGWIPEDTGVDKNNKVNEDFENNSIIAEELKMQMRPYIIPDNHPVKKNLDAIFKKTRVTTNRTSFENAGFTILSLRTKLHACIATHAFLKGYIIKAYLDTQLEQKIAFPSWKCLIMRCRGADQIRKTIKEKKINHFIIASKWIYPLPVQPEPPVGAEYKRQLSLLVATDMHLTCTEINLYAWRNYITKEHLKELYCIISRSQGSSYRPDNIAYTSEGKFAFIDTEYPDRGPDYRRIRKHLSWPMRKYWDLLIKTGGNLPDD